MNGLQFLPAPASSSSCAEETQRRRKIVTRRIANCARSCLGQGKMKSIQVSFARFTHKSHESTNARTIALHQFPHSFFQTPGKHCPSLVGPGALKNTECLSNSKKQEAVATGNIPGKGRNYCLLPTSGWQRIYMPTEILCKKDE